MIKNAIMRHIDDAKNYILDNDMMPADVMANLEVRLANRDGRALGGVKYCRSEKRFTPYLSFPVKRISLINSYFDAGKTYFLSEYAHINHLPNIGGKECQTLDEYLHILVSHEMAHAVQVYYEMNDNKSCGADFRNHGRVFQTIYDRLRNHRCCKSLLIASKKDY